MSFAAAAAVALVLALQRDDASANREAMVRNQIQARGVRSPDVLAAMRSVPRHLFVPPEAQPFAYSDRPLPIGFRQTISQPYIVALMTELLETAKDQRVLEIGTGSGYQAAVLSLLVKDVYSIELEPELAQRSAALLKSLGYANVVVKQGDGYLGWPEKSPFDRVILTAAPPSIPQTLIDQLKPGGLLVGPEGGSGYQELVVVSKDKQGRVRRKTAIPVMFVPMRKPAA
jgi:protein-L-isoaspartate(D-aspartate) O-methyltransferase